MTTTILHVATVKLSDGSTLSVTLDAEMRVQVHIMSGGEREAWCVMTATEAKNAGIALVSVGGLVEVVDGAGRVEGSHDDTPPVGAAGPRHPGNYACVECKWWWGEHKRGCSKAGA